MRPNAPRLALLTLMMWLWPPQAGAQTDAPDRLKADADATDVARPAAVTPPHSAALRIIFSERSAVLVLVDGQPVLRPVEGEADLLRVVNTRALIISDRERKKYYLRLMGDWLEADALKGPWWITKDAPPALEHVKDELARGGQVDLLTQAPEDGKFPNVYVSTVPTELIRTKGGPRFKPIKGSNLLYVENTGGSVFYDIVSRRFYVLVTGRWLGADALEGPWADVPGGELPAGFRRIPASHPKAGVLASVPGAPTARGARQNRAASVIQTTTAGP